MSVSIEVQAITSENSQISVGGAGDAGGVSRSRLLESSIAMVEDVRGPVVRVSRSPENFSADFQVCLPYRGLFVWHVAANAVVGDANQVLFVSGGESYCLSQPVASEYAELIITPDLELLTELAHAGGSLTVHPLFRRRSRRVDLDLQHLRTRFLHHLICREWNGMAAEEWVITVLRSALTASAESCEPSGRTRRLIGRTKQFLETHLASPIRLIDVAGRGCLTGISHRPLSPSRRGPAAWLPDAVATGSGPRRASERGRSHDARAGFGVFQPQSFYGRLSARVRLHPVPVSRVNTPHPLIASRSAWSPDASSTARHNSVQISSPQSARLLDRPIGRARSACRERTGSVPMSSGACRHGKTSGWMPCPHPQSAHAVQCSGVHWRNSQTPLASLTERRG
jgi:hypothetical protein